jgi:hypothetical protein
MGVSRDTSPDTPPIAHKKLKTVSGSRGTNIQPYSRIDLGMDLCSMPDIQPDYVTYVKDMR